MTIGLKQVVLLVLVFSTVGFFGYGYYRYTQDTQPEEEEEIVQITLTINYSLLRPTDIQRYNVSNQQSAFDILTTYNNVSYTSYGTMGHFIDGINGVVNNVNISNYYWIIYVNNKKSQVGADAIYPTEGMELLFNYEPLS